MSLKKITYEIKNNIGHIGFGKDEEKSLTTFSKETLLELDQTLDKVGTDKSLEGLIFFSHKEDCFLAGIDVSMIGSLDSESIASEGAYQGQKIFNKIEDLAIPTMALVDGFCLGGGLELVLSCNKIIASDSSKTKIGLPEVMLGVLPGFGGTYRLPRKIGLTKALDLLLTGKQVNAKKALNIGLADFVMPKERMLPLAQEYLKKSPKDSDTFSDKATQFAEDTFLGRKIIFQKAREQVMKLTKGFYPAPLRILELLEANWGRKRDSFLQEEAKAFGELSQTKQSKNLVHIFFLQDNAKKARGDKNQVQISQAAVLGAGTMGGGIAWYFAKNDIPTYMKDISTEGLDLGLKQASRNFAKDLKKKKLSEDQFQRKMRSIQPTLNYDGFKGVDIVVEAIVENMEVKQKVLAEAEKQVSKEAIITSNTSSLSLNEMSEALEFPERFAGLHFFNPVNKMPLVEIITHEKVNPEVINRLYNLTLACKKTPVIVKDGPGFLVNRILGAYLNEVGHLLSEGLSVESLDEVALEFGLPMGPCHLIDEVGIDVALKVGEVLYKGLGDRFKTSNVLKQFVSAGALGTKTKKGFYLYDENGKKTEQNKELTKGLSTDSKQIDSQTLRLRLILPMINEASYCLQENIVESVDELDLAMIFGIGFPPFRGGLLRFANNLGIEKVVKNLEKFQEDIDHNRFCVSEYLKEMISSKRKF
jgi:3-hydroxyacyl-CoA dehydrogenase/enoyl-CoA hydratase/3-hydroxybutyryl-CoA epimerase